jgi:hypothetical protein
MAGEWIIPLHMALGVFLTFYGIVFSKSWFDYVYLIFMYLMVVHWTFLNGECIVSYHFKRLNDPAYIMGEDVNENEIDVVFKDYPYTVKIAMFLKNLIWTITLYLVLKRCKFSKNMTFVFTFLFFIYHMTRTFTTDHCKNEPFLIFQEIIKYAILLYGILFFYILYKRL